MTVVSHLIKLCVNLLSVSNRAKLSSLLTDQARSQLALWVSISSSSWNQINYFTDVWMNFLFLVWAGLKNSAICHECIFMCQYSRWMHKKQSSQWQGAVLAGQVTEEVIEAYAALFLLFLFCLWTATMGNEKLGLEPKVLFTTTKSKQANKDNLKLPQFCILSQSRWGAVSVFLSKTKRKKRKERKVAHFYKYWTSNGTKWIFFFFFFWCGVSSISLVNYLCLWWWWFHDHNTAI